ncbi:MAG: hypothetical protein L7F78_01910, partial [Syntrophales bacterium LBB04]|nr:hypothetical protein [Syntrophales bacterium LBB04]
MYIPQIVMIIVALAVILLWLWERSQDAHSKNDRTKLPAIILTSWIIAAAVFGNYFFTLRIAGIPDITIERLLFILMMIYLVKGMFQGEVHFQENMSIEITMGIFLLICILSMMRTGFAPLSPDLPSPWFVFISGYLFPFIVFIFAKNFIVNEKDLTTILHALFYFGVYLSITAFFEYTNLR